MLSKQKDLLLQCFKVAVSEGQYLSIFMADQLLYIIDRYLNTETRHSRTPTSGVTSGTKIMEILLEFEQSGLIRGLNKYQDPIGSMFFLDKDCGIIQIDSDFPELLSGHYSDVVLSTISTSLFLDDISYRREYLGRVDSVVREVSENWILSHFPNR